MALANGDLICGPCKKDESRRTAGFPDCPTCKHRLSLMECGGAWGYRCLGCGLKFTREAACAPNPPAAQRESIRAHLSELGWRREDDHGVECYIELSRDCRIELSGNYGIWALERMDDEAFVWRAWHDAGRQPVVGDSLASLSARLLMCSQTAYLRIGTRAGALDRSRRGRPNHGYTTRGVSLLKGKQVITPNDYITAITPAHQWTNGGDRVRLLKCVLADGGAYGGFKWPLTVGAKVEAPDWDPR